MRRPMLLFTFTIVACNYIFLVAGRQSTQASQEPLSVDGARPIAKAMAILEHRYQLPVTYEDSPYVYRDDLEDATVAPNAARPILAPRRWRIDSDVRLPQTATKAEIAGLITRLLHAAAQSRGVSRDQFMVLPSNYGLHVVPTFIRNAQGVETPVTPLLDVPITVPAQHANLYSTLRLFCDAVSTASNVKTALAPVPVDFGRRISNLQADKQRARDVLIRLLNEQGLVLSWHLLYEPTSNSFVLNLAPLGWDMRLP